MTITAKQDTRVKELAKPQRYPIRLQKAIKSCQDLKKPMLSHRHKILEKYSAGYYDGNPNPARPINMIMRGVQILVPLLVSNNPKAMILADKPELRPFADTLSKLLDKRIRQIELWKVLRKAVYNSLWGIGVTCTNLRSKNERVEYDGENIALGKMYVDYIDMEDFVYDPMAREYAPDECEFIGHKYLLSMDNLKDSGEYKNYDEVKPVTKLWGDTSPDDIAKNIQDFKFRELHDYCEVYDLYLPQKKIIVTLPCDGQGRKYLKTTEWDGPEFGPYDVLGYNFFPDSLIPIPPIYSWLDQDEQLNKMARKMFMQSSREKTVLAYESGSEKDAERIVDSVDGSSARVDSIDRMKEVKFGGVNSDLWPVIQWLRNSIGEINNIDILSQGSGAKTLGQEQMTMQNAAASAEDMVWQIHHFTTSILKKLAHFEWTDPGLQETITKTIGPVDLKVTVNFNDLEGEEMDYFFDIQPYSMQRMSPNQLYQKTLQWIGQVVLPTLQLGAQQGAQLNVVELAQRTAKYLQIDTSGLYTPSPQMNAQAGSYQPLGGSSSGMGDGDRFGVGGGSNQMSDLNSQQAKSYQQSSAGAF